jgi:drug/metabolite transporter (DMT)-like permease
VIQGLVASGIVITVMSWCIQVRGPVYVSMFSPIMLIAVAIMGWGILDEKIHVGRYELDLTHIVCSCVH